MLLYHASTLMRENRKESIKPSRTRAFLAHPGASATLGMHHEKAGDASGSLRVAHAIHICHVLAERLVHKIADLLPRLDHVVAHPKMKICIYIDGSLPASL